MHELRALSLIPFVPSGKSYELSRRLFADFGFEEIWENGSYAGFRNGGAEFILQDLDHEELAANLMIKIVVADVDRWWEEISPKRLEDAYPGVRIRPPTDFPWGREIHVIDLAGVCWHIGR